MSCSLNAKNISYKREDKLILEDISFDLGHKEKIAIVGANGSGKSTLLKILAGLKEASSGELYIFHNLIKDKKEYQKFREEIAYLPQDISSFFLCITVIEDIMFSLRTRGFSKEEAYKKSFEMLKKLDILHLENRVILELSGGEQKIVALAALLINEPKILFLDEPTNALDEHSERKILQILKETQKSMIIISHHKSFVEDLSNKIYRLKDKTLSLEKNI